MKRMKIVLPLLLAVLAQTGCRGPYGPLTRPDPNWEPHQFREGISMLSKNVRDALLLVKGPEATRAPGGQIQVRTVMESRFPEGTVWADVQYIFFDGNKMPVEKSEWRPTAFPGREPVLLKGNSLRNDVVAFNIQLKNLRTPDGRLPRSPGWVFEWGIYFESILPQ